MYIIYHNICLSINNYIIIYVYSHIHLFIHINKYTVRVYSGGKYHFLTSCSSFTRCKHNHFFTVRYKSIIYSVDVN